IVSRLAREGLLAEPFDDARDVEITEVTTDSRQAAPGVLFCAIRGTAGDGHRFLNAVRSAGGAAALVEEVDPAIDLLQVRVTDGRRAAAFAAAEHFGNPWE